MISIRYSINHIFSFETYTGLMNEMEEKSKKRYLHSVMKKTYKININNRFEHLST